MVVKVSSAGRTFVLSDIDGTLVPHPFFSGLTNTQRAAYIERMLALFAREDFGVVTGRAEESFQRLFSDSNLKPCRPKFLGLEFAAVMLGRDEAYVTPKNFAPLNTLMRELAEATGARQDFASDEDLLTLMARGRIEGYLLEPKSRLAQVEWYFSDVRRQEAFGHFLREWLNPRLLDLPEITVQLFPTRVDLLERGFRPKWGFFERLPPGIFERLFSGYSRLVVLGDELYDSYMFRYVKTLQGGPFSRVECYSVGGPLPYADGTFATIAEALEQVEKWLQENPSSPSF